MSARGVAVAGVLALAAGCGGGGSGGAPSDVVRLKFDVIPAKATPDSNEWAQPDLAGADDSLIPVASNYPLPDVPARLHDVATLRAGRYLRPRIPTARTTADGRIGIGLDASDQLRLMLFTPESLSTHWTQAHDGSADFMAPEVYRVSLADLVPPGSSLHPLQFAVCDTTNTQLDDELFGGNDAAVHRNPKPVSDTAEAYEFSVFSGAINGGVMTDRMFAVTLRVVVENAKTANARIVEIDRVGGPLVATLPYTPNAVLEPNITGDGRLLVARVRATLGSGGDVNSATAKPWVDQTGVTRQSFFDVVYAYNDPASGYPPCDPRAWTNLKPISYANADDAVRDRYGFAKYPMRDPEGTLVQSGEDAGLAYPWIDSRGTNVFFTTTHRWPSSDDDSYARPDALDAINAIAPSQSSLVSPAPPGTSGQPHLMLPASNVIPLPGGCASCDEPTAFAQAIPTHGVGVFGLWTKGKMVLMDDMAGGMDFTVRAADAGQKLARLYHGTGGVVRIGNGFTNVGLQPSVDLDTWWPYNDAIIESLVNKFYFSPHFRPADPHDAVWTISTGHGSAELAFDPYMDEQAVILSDMSPSMTAAHGPVEWLITNYGDRYDAPMRLENSATGTTGLVPPYGAVIGDSLQGTRIEPVPLGGVNGKGLWLSDLAGVQYTIPSSASSTAQAVGTLYIGLFIDPRFTLTAAFDRRIVTLPTGSVNLVGDGTSTSLAFRAASWEGKVALPAALLQQQSWMHVGLEIDAAEIRVYLNGFLFDIFDKSAAPGALMLAAGNVVLGSPDSGTTGFRGWTDEFTVLARALNSAEDACELARGSIVRDISASPVSLYPAYAHAAIASAIGDPSGTNYVCRRDYSGQGYGFLAGIPPDQRVDRLLKHVQPLHFNQPRPDESGNAFCLMCHRPDQASESLTPSVLAPLSIPMQLDSRRQPLQPYPLAIGDIPMNWLATGPPQPERFDKNGQWLFVDEFIDP